MIPDPKWTAAVDKLTGVSCGRLDMSSYTGDGEPERFVYLDQHAKDERTCVTGPYCDEVAYMAAMYPVLRARVKELEQERAGGGEVRETLVALLLDAVVFFAGHNRNDEGAAELATKILALVAPRQGDGDGWIACSESMPEKGRSVLVCWVGDREVREAFRNVTDGHWRSDIARIPSPSHWRLKPDPPINAPKPPARGAQPSKQSASNKLLEAAKHLSGDELLTAIGRGGLDLCPCRICGQLVACIPDGICWCEDCAAREHARA